MNPLVFKAKILVRVFAFFFVLFSGCDRITPLPKEPPAVSAPMPTAEELYVFPFGRLSMTAYEVFRREFPEVAPRDLARLAMAVQWLGSRPVLGKAVTPQETARRVRVLFLPTVPPSDRRLAKRFFSEHFAIPSIETLSRNFNGAARGWAVEWNPSLAREYRIAP